MNNYDTYNSMDFDWPDELCDLRAGIDLPYVDQYDDCLTAESIFVLAEIQRIWTPDLSDQFYEMWDEDDSCGAILDDYWYFLRERFGDDYATALFIAGANKSKEFYMTNVWRAE